MVDIYLDLEGPGICTEKHGILPSKKKYGAPKIAFSWFIHMASSWFITKKNYMFRILTTRVAGAYEPTYKPHLVGAFDVWFGA